MAHYLLAERVSRKMSSLTLVVQSNAVIAKPISSRALATLILWDVAAGRTRTVVVMNAICSWLLDFIDGIELSYFRHLSTLLSGKKIITPEQCCGMQSRWQRTSS